jgi:hypothetical protein
VAIGETRFFILVTFYLDWVIILVRHWQAFFNQRLQTAGNKYQSKNFPLTNSTEVINISIINHKNLNIQANTDFKFKNQYIKKLLYEQLKL